MAYSAQHIQQELTPLIDQLTQHPVYKNMNGMEDLHIFMQHHVYAVWDFMSLLKALQLELTSTEVPWMPSPYPISRRLVNEIVLEEESDEGPEGTYMSHFEMYLAAMEEVGADASGIHQFTQAVIGGARPHEALKAAAAPEAVREFVGTTFRIIETGGLHEVASAFTFGREDVIPALFRSFIADLDRLFPGKLRTLRYYLDRHVALDEEAHGPMALRMVADLCGEDNRKWDEALGTAHQALQARKKLWDGIDHAIAARHSVNY